MQGYEVYLPSRRGDGREVEAAEVRVIKEKLAQAFGGYTQVTQRCEGAWKMGGVTFRDEITILRVLDDGSSDFDMVKFRAVLEERLQQQRVLITARQVTAL